MSETAVITATGSSSQQAAGRKRILIVESDGFTRLMLIVRFRMARVGVDFAYNGDLALRRLRRAVPDALLVGLDASDLSGVELVRKARKDPQTSGCPIYVFTHTRALKRGLRKELQTLATEVFDKASVCIVEVVRSIMTGLAQGGEGEPRESAAGAAAEEPASAGAAQPAECGDAFDGVLAQWESLVQCAKPGDRAQKGAELLHRVQSLAQCAETAGARDLAKHAKAAAKFLNLLCQQHQAFTKTAVDLFGRAVESMSLLTTGPGGEAGQARFTAAIIDETPPSNQALSDVLMIAGVRPVVFADPAVARTYLAAHSVDLIIANIQAPELHGLDPAAIGQLPPQAATPVIFVPELTASDPNREWESTHAPLLNTNPALLTELVMKALNEVEKKDAPQDGAPPSAPAPALPPGPFFMAKPQRAASPAIAAATPAPAHPQANPFQVRAAALPPSIPEQIFQRTAAPASVPAAADPVSQLTEAPVESVQVGNTILFVEDDPFTLKVYTKALVRCGYQVEVAADGEAAIEALARSRPRMVILDLMLPKVSGLEVLKFIRGDSQLKSTPVLVLSNAYLEHLGARARRAGANAGMSKTECGPEKLVEKVRELLGARPAQGAAGVAPRESDAVMAGNDAELAAETAIWIRQADLRAEAPKEVAQIRRVCLECIRAVDREQGPEELGDLYRRIRFLSAHAALIGFTKISEVSSVLEGLLFEVLSSQVPPARSTFQTIAQAVDLLDQLVRYNDTTFAEPRVKPKVLVVDPDPDSNITLVTALKRGNFDALGVHDPVEGLRMLKATRYDLVLLDIHTPFLNGFEVCEQLRRMPQYKAVPVIFLTHEVEFQDRARSVIVGGNDLIARSASSLERILKVTTHLLKPQGQNLPAGENGAGRSAMGASEADGDSCESIEEVFNRLPVPGETELSSAAPVQAAAPGEDLAAGPGSEAGRAAESSQAAEYSMAAFSALSGEVAAGAQSDPGALATADTSVGGSDAVSGLVAAPLPDAGQEGSASALPTASENLEPSSVAQQPCAIDQSGDNGGEVAEPTAMAPDTSTDAEQAPDTIQGDEAFSGLAAAPPRTAADHEREREKLVNRIFTAENDLYHAQASIKERDALIESLQKQVDEFGGGRMPQDLAAAEPSVEGVVDFVRAPEAHPGAEAAPATPSEAALNEAQARIAELEQALASLREARQQLDTQVAQAQQVSADSEQRVRELEQDLGQRSAELEAARAELGNQAQEREQAESGLRQQLEQAGTAMTQSEAAHQETMARCAGLEQELAGLREAREQLGTQIAQAEQTSAESDTRIKELEEDLGRRTAELQQAKGEIAKQAEERARLESELRERLEQSGAAMTQSEAAHQETMARCAGLEQELAGLREAREQLSTQIAQAEQASAKSETRIKELEEDLGRRTAELQQAKGEITKQAEDRTRLESELRQQLEQNGVAMTQSEAAHQETMVRCAELEQELAGLREAREQLNTQVAEEQKASTQSVKRVKELEKKLGLRAAELLEAKGEIEKQSRERARVESALRQQLEAAGAAAGQGEAARKQALTRCGELEQELAGLREAREQLNTQVADGQKASTQSDRHIKKLQEELGRRAAELQQAKTEAEKQSKARARVESELRQQLEAAGAAAGQSEAAHKQALTRCGELEQELAGLREAREQLNTQVAEGQKASTQSDRRIKKLEEDLGARAAALEAAKAEAEKQAQARARVESELRQQLEAAGAAAGQSEAVHKQALTRCGELEQELAGMREAQEQLNTRVADGQKASTQSDRRIRELEEELSARAAALEEVKAENAKGAQERAHAESELRQQMEQIGAAASQSDAAHKQALTRCGELEQELAGLREAREQFNAQVAESQKAAAESGKRIKELEKRLELVSTDSTAHTLELERRIEEGVAALARATADLAKERGERARSDQRATALNSRLQQLHEESRRMLECHREDQERLGNFEAHLREQDEAMTRNAADLKHEQAARRLVEEQLLEAKELNAHFHNNLAFFETANQALNQARQELQGRLETTMNALQESGSNLHKETAERQGLAATLEKLQRELEGQRRKRESLEAELEATVRALHEREATLEQENAERQRLHRALETAEAAHRNQSQRADLELGNLKSALQAEQVERNRQETQNARMRQSALSSARGARSLRNTLRRQIRGPVQDLYQASRNLLQFELGDEQRKVAETILQDVLLVHNRIEEPEPPQDDAAGQGAPASSGAASGADE